MKTVLYTNARDEINILEWVIHHLNLGFTYIYIYDHLSKIPIKSIVKNIKNVKVERIENEEIHKTDLMDKSFHYSSSKNIDWMLYLDADEFLIFQNDDNVKNFLEKYNKYTQIGINWLNFGSNLHNKNPNGTILENYTKCDKQFHTNIKSFIRPNEVEHVINPHCFKMKNMELSVGTNFQVLNKETTWCFHNPDNMNNVSAYIAHYIFQSYETYLNRKKNRKRDDTGENWDWGFDEKTLHNVFNDIDNFLPRDKYNNSNKETMKKYL